MTVTLQRISCLIWFTLLIIHIPARCFAGDAVHRNTSTYCRGANVLLQESAGYNMGYSHIREASNTLQKEPAAFQNGDLYDQEESDTSQKEPAEPSIEGEPVHRITIIGNHNISEDQIMRAFGIRRGEPFSTERSEKGIKRVERLSGVDAAVLKMLRDRNFEGIHLVIIITEAETRLFRPVISRTITNRWSFGVIFSERNFRGENEKLFASVLLRGATILRAGWMKPSFPEAPFFGIGLSVSYEDYDYPFPDFNTRLLDERIKRYETAVHFTFNPHYYFTVTVSPGVEKIDMTDSIAVLEGGRAVPPSPSGTFTTLEVGVELNMLDREFYPSSGFKISAARRDWGLFQDEAEIKNFLYKTKGALYFRFRRMIWGFWSRAVFTHGNVPVTLFQHLGGEGSIRGYDFGIFSGANSILGTAELRVPLNFTDIAEPGNPIVLADFHLFVDGGACWSPPDELDTERFNSGFGCGFNIMPARKAILSIDYAWERKSSGKWQIDVRMPF